MNKFTFSLQTIGSQHDRILRRITNNINDDGSAKNILNQLELLHGHIKTFSFEEDEKPDREILKLCMRSISYGLSKRSLLSALTMVLR